MFSGDIYIWTIQIRHLAPSNYLNNQVTFFKIVYSMYLYVLYMPGDILETANMVVE